MTKKKEEKEKEEKQLLDPAEEFMGSMDKIVSFQRDRSLNIYQRIHKVMEEVWYVKKREKQDGFYPTLEHDDVTNKLRPSMVRHGIVTIPEKIDDNYITLTKEKFDRNSGDKYEQLEHFVDLKYYVRFVNIDNPQDYVVGVGSGHGIDAAGNATGKAISYAFKYILSKLFFLESGVQEDRDHLFESEPDPNAEYMYNSIGKELFGKEWDKIGKKKIYQITRGKTSDASRAPSNALNIAIRNLFDLKKKKEENPDKEIKDLDKDQEKDKMNDILKDFED